MNIIADKWYAIPQVNENGKTGRLYKYLNNGETVSANKCIYCCKKLGKAYTETKTVYWFFSYYIFGYFSNICNECLEKITDIYDNGYLRAKKRLEERELISSYTTVDGTVTREYWNGDFEEDLSEYEAKRRGVKFD